MMRDIVEPILEIRYANATPIISNSSPSIIILGKIRNFYSLKNGKTMNMNIAFIAVMALGIN